MKFHFEIFWQKIIFFTHCIKIRELNISLEKCKQTAFDIQVIFEHSFKKNHVFF